MPKSRAGAGPEPPPRVRHLARVEANASLRPPGGTCRRGDLPRVRPRSEVLLAVPSPHCPTRRRALLIALLCTPPLACAPAAPPPAIPSAVRAAVSPDTSTRAACRTAPVPGPVTDGFRPPPRPWAAGNRGLEYASTPGTPVRAAASGTVAFAGPVGGRLAVSIDHADGRRSTYSPLGSLLVVAGQRVQRAQPVGRSVERLHFGVRQGHRYLDPVRWLARPCRAVLVPLSGS